MQTTQTLPACRWCEALSAFPAQLARKASWVRINRLLAWALVASPLLQILLRTKFINGLLFDAGLLVIHAVLSLWLFGMPKAPRGEGWMLWLAMPPRGMSLRSRFLVWPWLIVVGVLWIPVAAVASVLFGPAAVVLLAALCVLWALQPVFVMAHAATATRYAWRRWGLGNESDGWVAGFIVAAFVPITNLANLLR